MNKKKAVEMNQQLVSLPLQALRYENVICDFISTLTLLDNDFLKFHL